MRKVCARLTEPESSGDVSALLSARPNACELPGLLKALVSLAEEADNAAPSVNERLRGDAFFSPLLEKLFRALLEDQSPRHLAPGALADAVRLYGKLGSASRARHHLLRLFAASEDRAALAAFAELLAGDPPRESQDVLLSFVPLFQSKNYPPDALFPRLLDVMGDATLATVVLDLANYLARSRRVERHPAAGRVERLAGLLGGVVGRLAQLQESPRQFAATAVELNKMVSDGTALVVALVNALALIGDASVTGKLHQTLELAHRQIRAEAAWALAKLGDETGLDILVEMAADPVARARVVAALEELGQRDKLPPEVGCFLGEGEINRPHTVSALEP